MSGKKILPNKFLNEAPSVISMMSTVISAGGSIDSAVRYVAEKGPRNTARMFREITSNVDCRTETDIRESLYAKASSLPKELSFFRRSLYLVISASESSDENERARILKEATENSLSGLKQSGEEYSSKLQTPCMLVFGLGIMVPMILLSIVPMLSMGSAIGMTMTVPESLLERVILVVIPAAVASAAASVKGKNPLMESAESSKGLWKGAAMFLALPLYMVLPAYVSDENLRLAISIAAPALVCLALVFPDVNAEKIRQKTEDALKDMLFDLGNRLVTGENFESASVSALSSRKECLRLSEALSREFAICRGDSEAAIEFVISPISKTMAGFIKDIYRASCRDIRDAGRLAIALAHQLQDQDTVRKGIANKLRNVTDMMNGTAMLFAPLILGMSIMMTGPLTSVTGGVDTEHTFTVISVYLTELAAIIAVFGSLLSCRFSPVNVIYRFSLTVPVAMAVLVACSSIAI